MYVGHDHSSSVIESQGYGSRVGLGFRVRVRKDGNAVDLTSVLDRRAVCFLVFNQPMRPEVDR